MLRQLWPLLGTDTVVECQRPPDLPRKGDLLRLAGYGTLYHAAQVEVDRLDHPRDLTLVMVVPSVTSALRDEIARMDWSLVWLGDGYGRIDGGMYATFLVVTDEVVGTEQKAFPAVFNPAEMIGAVTIQWFWQWLVEEKRTESIEQLEGYEELRRKLMPSGD